MGSAAGVVGQIVVRELNHGQLVKTVACWDLPPPDLAAGLPNSAVSKLKELVGNKEFGNMMLSLGSNRKQRTMGQYSHTCTSGTQVHVPVG